MDGVLKIHLQNLFKNIEKQEWMVNDMRIDEAIKFAEHAQTMTDIPEVKEFYAMAEKALRTQNQVNWISATEKLPIVFQQVLLWDAIDQDVFMGELDGDGEWFVRGYSPDDFNITHWMPLPEPPEREGE